MQNKVNTFFPAHTQAETILKEFRESLDEDARELFDSWLEYMDKKAEEMVQAMLQCKSTEDTRTLVNSWVANVEKEVAEMIKDLLD